MFSLLKIEKVSIPHPYCITPKHIAVAADDFGGMLGEAAIEAAERKGAVCDICRERARRDGSRILTYGEHENNVTLFVKVPQNRDLNAIEGLNKYLFDNKQTFVDAGIQGFAFPS